MVIDPNWFPYQPLDSQQWSKLPDTVFVDVNTYSLSMILWCKRNITKYWHYNRHCYSTTFHFESEEDRAIFILRWL